MPDSAHRPGEPISLRPQPKSLGSCPRCDEPLDVIALHLAGWRSLARGSCPRCGGRFLQDLPAGHGLLYPATLDLDSGKTHAAPGSEWFADPLRDYWQLPDAGAVELAVERRREVSDARVLNCLDVVYGHALLKLLNASRELASGAELVALVPRSLAQLVPAEAAEVWSVDASPARLRRWLLELESRLDGELARFESASLSPAFPHPHPSVYRLSDFAGSLEPERAGEPSIVLSLRDDRRWGRTARGQARRVEELSKLIRRRFPRAGFVAVGVGGASPLPADVDDRRTQRPSVADEHAWLRLCAGADLVIGVHGSNMLLPSGLARVTIELVPLERYGNALQATLLGGGDALETLWSHRFLYGSATLDDVSPARVAALAETLLADDERFRAVMLGPLAGRGGTVPPPVGASDPAPLSTVERVRRGAAWVRNAGRAAGRIAGERAATTAAAARARSGDRPPRVMTDARGLRYELVSRTEIGQFIRHGGHFEHEEIDLLVEFARQGDQVLDVGANIGAFTAPLARAVAPGGTVHAFEPMDISRRRLARTLELNELSNVELNPVAVGAECADVELVAYGEGYESWASTVPRRIELGSTVMEPVERATVEATTIDAYCEQHAIERVSIVKIDVEGGEPAVLAGAGRLLAEGAIDVLLFELSDNTLPDSVRPHEVVDQVTRQGYRTFVLSDGVLAPFRPSGYLAFANVIAVRPEVLPRLPRPVGLA